MALCCVCGVILSLCGYDFVIWPILGGPSILPLAFLYLTLYAFNFSSYYRVFLHYIVVNEFFACIDYLYGIPISNNGMAVLYITIICIFFFIILYLRFKERRKQLNPFQTNSTITSTRTNDMNIENKKKRQHKMVLVFLKIIPILLVLCHISNTFLSLFGYDSMIWSILGGMSVIPLAFLYLTSYALKFCAYHRMFLHYIVYSEILSWVDYCYELPISNRALFCWHFVIAGIFLFLILFLRFKVCKNQSLN